MTILYQAGEGERFKISSDLIAAMLLTPGDFTKVEITGNINCCTTGCEQQVSTVIILTPFTTTDDIVFGEGSVYVNPTFFGFSVNDIGTFPNGVYRFSIKIFTDGAGTTFEENCIFYDLDIKCKVGALLKALIEENKTKAPAEKKSTMAHLLHYGLVNGSNCGCNCTDMCEAYRALDKILSSVNPQIFVDCGC